MGTQRKKDADIECNNEQLLMSGNPYTYKLQPGLTPVWTNTDIKIFYLLFIILMDTTQTFVIFG